MNLCVQGHTIHWNTLATCWSGEVIEPGERASPRREVDSERINPALCQAFASGFARGMAWGWLYFKDITPELPVGLEMSIIITGEWNRLCCGS